MDQFDQAARQIAGRGEFDAAASEVITKQQQPVRTSLYGALLADPEVAARAARLGRQTGLPADMVERNLPEVQRQAKLDEYDRVLLNSPVTARWIAAEQANARVAHDNLPSMTAIERSFLGNITEPVQRGLAQGRRGLTLLFDQMGIFKGLERQRAQAAAAHGITYDPAAELAARMAQQQREVERYPVPDDIARGMQDIGSAQTMGDAFAAIRSNPRAVLETTLQSLGASMPALVSAAGGSVFGPGGTAAGAGLGSFAVEYGNTLQDVMAEKGVNGSDALSIRTALNNPELMAAARDKALKRGVPVAIFDALTAGVAGKLLAGAKPAAVSVSTRAAGELAVQAGGGAAGEAGAQLATGEYKPGDILLEAFAEMPTAVVEVPGNYRRAMESAQRAQKGAEFLDNLNQLAGADKLRVRDPETFEQFIAQVSEGGPVQQVFINAQALMQSGVAEQVAALSPAVAAQIATAAQTGGQIAIPVEEYATRIAPTEYAQSLLDHLKTEPEGFSRAEAQDFMQNHTEELQAEVERVLTEKQGDDNFKALADDVKAAMRAQLDAVSRFSGPVNDAYASMVGNFYAVMGAKLGVSPRELFERYPLRVAAERLDGDSLDQANRAVQVEVARWQKALLRMDGKDMDYAPALPTPTVLRVMGIADAKLAFPSRAALQIGKKHPDVSLDVLKNLPALLHDPLYVYDHADGGVNVVVDAKTAKGEPIVVGVRDGRVRTITPFNDADGYSGAERLARNLAAAKGRIYARNDEAPAKARASVSAPDRTFPVEVLTRNRHDVITRAALVKRYGDEFYQGARALDTPQVQVDGKWRPADNSQDQIESGIGKRGAFDGSDANILSQGNRGAFNPATNTITLLKGADLSTFLHESGHAFLEMQIDIAARIQPDAATDGERQILKDTDALLKWFGVRDLGEWQSLDFEEKRSYHEQFARGFEAYLFEGKAPSIELQPLFQRFRAWLVSVYRELKNLNVELTDEVRGVFDRMLATTEQIQLAEQGRSMLPLFTSPEQAGATPEEFAAYHAQGVDATNNAIQDLQARTLRDLAWTRNARGREIKKLQKQAHALRAEVQMEVRGEVLSRPVYQAWQFLTAKGDDVEQSGKLDRAAVKTLGLPDEIAQRVVQRKMTGADGQHPDVVAEVFGFTSGDELVRELAAAQPPKDEIEALTDVRMLERYGDLSSPEAIERAADVAIHNEARGRFIATQLNLSERALGKKKTLAKAARQFAETMISRLRVRDIRPGQYAAAEVRAARAAEKAAKAGDLAVSVAEQRNMLVNNYATRAAYNAQDEVETGVTYLKKFEREGVRKALDDDYLQQIDALVERFDLRKQSNKAADRTVSLRTWVQGRLKAGEIPDIADTLLSPAERGAYLAEVQSRDEDGELLYADDEDAVRLLAEAIDRSARRSYRDLTVEEFRGLVDTVKSIEHLGRLKNQILTARDMRNYQAIRDNIAGGIKANAKGSDMNTRTANDWLGQKLQGIRQFGAAHIKVATWARIMDGGQDNGPVWRYLVQPANERATQETTMRAEATQALDDILRPVLAKVSALDKMGSGRAFPALGTSLNWQERFAILLNVGNESNMQRLLDGGIAGGTRALTPAQLQDVLRTFTAEELRAAQAVWDHFETYRPQIAEKERRVSGKEPQWIPIRPITIQSVDGQAVQLRGGYFPVMYDPRVNLKAGQHSAAEDAKNLLRAAHSTATTRRSFVKTRTDEVKGRPLLLNLQGLYSGVNDVIHDLAWHEWVIDANKLLRSNTIDSAIREHYGPEVKREFEKWRDDIVAGTRRLDHAIERAAGFARQNVSAAALAYNVMTAALQPLGAANSIARIGAGWFGKGLARYVAGPITATREAQALSAWMANRPRTRFRELNELRNQVQGQTAAREVMGRYGYWLMTQAQLMVDVPTWWGAYEKSIADGQDERTAINLADQAVKDSQGGGEEVDQSGVERGGPLVKLFTAFYSFMGTTLNTATLTATTEKNQAKRAVNLLLVLSVAPLAGDMLKGALIPGGDDDDDDDEPLAKKLLAAQLSFLFGLVAFGREFTPAAKALFGEGNGMGYSGPAGLRVISDTVRLGQQMHQGDFDLAFVKAFTTWLGDLSGIPAVQINRTITGANALGEGETDNPAAIAFGFQENR